jgi:hypothetical protein
MAIISAFTAKSVNETKEDAEGATVKSSAKAGQLGADN